MKILLAASTVLLAASLAAEPVCVGEVCYPSREAAIAAGALPRDGGAVGSQADTERHVEDNEPNQSVKAGDDKAIGPQATVTRIAFGYMRPPELLAFMRGEGESTPFADRSAFIVILLVLLGGLVANLTPCVLPLVPVNVAILLGRAESTRTSRLLRGLAYGGGMAAAYGALGLAAVFGGMAFGAVQSSPWFNMAVATVFIVLGLGMLDVFNIDASVLWRRFFSKGRSVSAPRPTAACGLGSAFLLGAGAAVLAGACVQPILLATLVYTADGFAAGRLWTISLPFVLGAGMGLPWLFVAAGLSVLPRPGAWMVWVKRGFAVVIFAMAVWYAYLAWIGFHPKGLTPHQGSDPTPQGLTPSPGSDPTPQGLTPSPGSDPTSQGLTPYQGSDPTSQGLTPETKGQIFEATPATWGQTLVSARAAGKPVFVDIWATWCKNCLAMEKSTFKDPEVIKELSKFSVIKLQAEDMAELSKVPELKELDIKGIPAFIILDL